MSTQHVKLSWCPDGSARRGNASRWTQDCCFLVGLCPFSLGGTDRRAMCGCTEPLPGDHRSVWCGAVALGKGTPMRLMPDLVGPLRIIHRQVLATSRAGTCTTSQHPAPLTLRQNFHRFTSRPLRGPPAAPQRHTSTSPSLLLSPHRPHSPMAAGKRREEAGRGAGRCRLSPGGRRRCRAGRSGAGGAAGSGAAWRTTSSAAAPATCPTTG